jgi:hypothetical protein
VGVLTLINAASSASSRKQSPVISTSFHTHRRYRVLESIGLGHM